LNSRQEKFAASVASGKTLVASYREVYMPSNDKAPSTYRNAKRSAKHPGIAARIKELQLERLPAAEDMRAVYQHGLAVIIGLSASCEDPRVRLSAAQFLIREAEKREKLEEARTRNQREGASPREELIRELRSLYAKALPERAPLVVEVSNGGTTDRDATAAAASEDEAEMREPEEIGSTGGAQFRLEKIPGRFGAGQYRRVRVEEP